ncbi:MAG: hypothetical protein Q8Q09_17720 [Deltaproteobacteria bacterium]|nr:hypothetical protein [Deltaproteobacteria bacterium]
MDLDSPSATPYRDTGPKRATRVTVGLSAQTWRLEWGCVFALLALTGQLLTPRETRLRCINTNGQRICSVIRYTALTESARSINVTANSAVRVLAPNAALTATPASGFEVATLGIANRTFWFDERWYRASIDQPPVRGQWHHDDDAPNALRRWLADEDAHSIEILQPGSVSPWLLALITSVLGAIAVSIAVAITARRRTLELTSDFAGRRATLRVARGWRRPSECSVDLAQDVIPRLALEPPGPRLVIEGPGGATHTLFECRDPGDLDAARALTIESASSRTRPRSTWNITAQLHLPVAVVVAITVGLAVAAVSVRAARPQLQTTGRLEVHATSTCEMDGMTLLAGGRVSYALPIGAHRVTTRHHETTVTHTVQIAPGRTSTLTCPAP